MKADGNPALAERTGSATCQHRMGHYSWSPSGTDRGDVRWCGKPATHVAEYPGKPPSYFCRKHSRSRRYVRESPNAQREPRRKEDGQ